MAVLHSTRLYISLPRLYFTRLDSTLFYHGSTSLYLTLHYSTMAQLHSILDSTLLYHAWIYVTLHDSTLVFHGSTSLYKTLH